MALGSYFCCIFYCNLPLVSSNNNKLADTLSKASIKSNGFLLFLLILFYIFIPDLAFVFVLNLSFNRYINKDYQRAIKLALNSSF